ncbi:serine/threonine-protein phosphatase, partial [bacterium]|nr:serine/threonine-protein phosphatase [bacterium]
PTIPGYDCFGKIQPASDLGGDCFDCQLLKDGKIFFLVGDVSGHGVSSALIMAFTRAVVFHWIKLGKSEPRSLAVALDKMLRHCVKKKMFMSLACGILDPERHILTYVGVGHPYPLFIQAEGRLSFLGSPVYPLGIYRKPFIPEPIEIPFTQGAKLLCYTDGMVESLSKSNLPLGYDGLLKLVQDTNFSAAKDWAIQLFERRRDFVGSDHQDDDVTLFVLSRTHQNQSKNP